MGFFSRLKTKGNAMLENTKIKVQRELTLKFRQKLYAGEEVSWYDVYSAALHSGYPYPDTYYDPWRNTADIVYGRLINDQDMYCRNMDSVVFYPWENRFAGECDAVRDLFYLEDSEIVSKRYDDGSAVAIFEENITGYIRTVAYATEPGQSTTENAYRRALA